MVERITTTGLQLELLTFVNFERLEALLGWNNSLIPASTYYSHNYSRIIGTGLEGSGDISLERYLGCVSSAFMWLSTLSSIESRAGVED